jgi:hypothetical protein
VGWCPGDGLVIATGVIEGACRYLVKGRLAITGARWDLPGDEVVLLLRAVITSGDFDAYWKFRLQHERQRTHTSRYQHQYDLADLTKIKIAQIEGHSSVRRLTWRLPLAAMPVLWSRRGNPLVRDRGRRSTRTTRGQH